MEGDIENDAPGLLGGGGDVLTSANDIARTGDVLAPTVPLHPSENLYPSGDLYPGKGN